MIASSMIALHFIWILRGLALAGQPGLLVDLLDQAGPQPGRGDQQPVVVGLPAVAGEVVEQVGDVLADLSVRR